MQPQDIVKIEVRVNFGVKIVGGFTRDTKRLKVSFRQSTRRNRSG